MNMMHSARIKGITLVLATAIFWGMSGIFTQYLLELGFTVGWLVSVRLTVAGIILLFIAERLESKSIWGILKNKIDVMQLLLFSVFGMVAVQYTFFNAIDYSNAATATVLHYLAPAIILCYLSIRSRHLPAGTEIFAVMLAITGTFLLVTKGSFNQIQISGWALFWGVASAVALAFYTLQPYRLLAKYNSIIVAGWAMLFGGVGASVIHQPWNFYFDWSIQTIFSVIFTIVFGTILSFYFYLASLQYIKPSETSLIATTEPLVVAFVSVTMLDVYFNFAEWIGIICIISMVVILSLVKEGPNESEKRKTRAD